MPHGRNLPVGSPAALDFPEIKTGRNGVVTVVLALVWIHVAANAPNVAIQEMSLGIHYNVGHDLLEFITDPEVLSPVDGFLPIPTKPGLGVTIDEAKVREVAKDGHRWRNPIWRHGDGSFAEW